MQQTERPADAVAEHDGVVDGFPNTSQSFRSGVGLFTKHERSHAQVASNIRELSIRNFRLAR